MTVYFVMIILVLLAGAGIHPRRSEHRRKQFMWTSFLIMVFVSGFRAVSVGADTADYVYMFKNINLLKTLSSRYEVGFMTYLYAIHKITDSTTVFLLVNSVICIGLSCIFIHKHSEEPCLAVLLYILLKSFFFQMTGLRQSLATSFILLGFSFLIGDRKKRDYLFSCLSIFFAISLHTIAIVVLIPFVIWIKPRNKLVENITPQKTLVLSLGLSVSAFVLYPYIMELVSYILPQYKHYFTGTWSDSNYSASLFKLLIQVVFLIVGVVYFQRKKELTESDRLSMIMMICTIVIGTLAMRMEIWGRLSGVFAIFTSLLWVPSFASVDPQPRNRIILKTSVFAFSFAYMVITFVFRPEWDGVVPYLFG